MLFRRPFAFLIKHFKVIHLTLTIMIGYLLLKMNDIFRFIGEYMNSNLFTIESSVTSSLFKISMWIVIVGILIITLIILGLMSYKKKPIRFYVFNILTYGFVTFVFIFCYAHIKILEINLLDIRTLKLMRDFCVFASILQVLSFIMAGIRATGFDIKKFDFDQDIDNLNITAEDNEEFEVDVELDTDKLRRTIRKKWRHMKYVYIENKLMIHIACLIGVACICFVIYMNLGVYHKLNQANEPFSTTEFMINIKNGYVTTKNYHSFPIKEGKKLLVIPYQIRTNYLMNKKTFQPERFTLYIGNQSFHMTDVYHEEVYDLGSSYQQEYLTTEFQEYILVYELPEEISTEKAILKYKDTNDLEIEIAIVVSSEAEESILGTYSLGQEIPLDYSLLKNSKLKINSYECNDVFTSTYTYCIALNNCLSGIEYIRPTVGNEEKALLKISGYFSLDENSSLTRLTDVYTVLRDFGSITYEINGESKVIRQFSQVKPTKKSSDDFYYIEVPKELLYAQHVKISFKFRNIVYEIVVK